MLIHVPLAQIDDNPYQRRRDYGDVESLAADIMTNGLLQVPRGRLLFDRGEIVTSYDLSLTLHRIQTDGFPAGLRVQLAFGHRRLRAFRVLAERGDGDTMPVYVEALDDGQMLDAVWSENQHRSDINAIEQAELLAAKLERAREAGGNQTTVAAEWRLDRSTIANKLRLLELPAEVQTAVRERRLSERQALALLPIVEMSEKLNGTTVDWEGGTNPQDYGRPIAPEAFMRHVIAKPETATSDRIRDYARQVAAHAGKNLYDSIATFDAGQGEGIVQPVCAGCRYRHNQSCLNPPCLDAKWRVFQAGISERAAELTGLPVVEADPRAYDDVAQAQLRRRLYDNGTRSGLAVAWTVGGYRPDWLQGTSAEYRYAENVWSDWTRGLFLVRSADAASLAAEESKQEGTELGELLIQWRVMHSDATKARRGRIIAALVNATAPLTNTPAALRALLVALESLRHGYGPGFDFDAPLGQVLDEYLSGRLQNTYLPIEKWDALIERAGLDPAVADLTDEADRLRETAVESLLAWYDHDHSPSTAGRVSIALGQVLNQFEAAGINEDDDELGDLLPWLRRAYDAAGDVINGREAGQGEQS